MKTVFSILSFVGMAATCFAQGTVFWGAIPFFAMTAQTNTAQYYGGAPIGGVASGKTAPASSGLVYYYELLYNTAFTGSQVSTPDYVTLFSGTWLDTGLTATNNNIAGRLAPVNPNSAAVVPWANGTTNNIMLVGWSANLGTSWAVVSNELANWNSGYNGGGMAESFFGESATGYLNPGSSNPGARVFGVGPGPTGLPINSLNTQLYILGDSIPTPEPSTLAFVGLSGLSLLLFRRLGAPMRGERSSRL